MATTCITFGSLMTVVNGIQSPLMDASTFVSETITPSASNQQTTQVAPAANICIARVATDGAIYVAFGASPNALTSTAARAMLPAGSVEYFFVVAGQKAAVTNAP